MDVTTAVGATAGSMMAEVAEKPKQGLKKSNPTQQPQGESGSSSTMVAERQQHQQQQKTVTPSPALLERKEAAKNAVALESSDSSDDNSNDGGKVESSISNVADGTNVKQNENAATAAKTPLKEKEDSASSNDASCESKTSLSLNRSVTIDPLIDVQTTPSSLKPSKLDYASPKEETFVPAFHQPWHQPYTTTVPPGVVDIDMAPHACCAHSLTSHAGYSWISSKRRCSCAKDSNHCSSENLTEAYLGSYGTDRFEGVGMTGMKGAKGIIGTSKVNDVDWNAERWWLNQTRKEMEYEARKNSSQKGSSGGSNPSKNLDNTTPIHDMFLPLKKSNKDKSGSDSSNDGTQSPTSSLSDVSPSNSPSRKSAQQQQQVLPQSIEEHLDYMARQPHITIEMRRILMDWLLEVTEEYKLSTEAFWLSVTLVDRALACSYDDGSLKDEKKGKGKKGKKRLGGPMIVEKDKVQLIGW